MPTFAKGRVMDGKYNPGDIVLSNWTLTRLIGEGGFGRVYEAEREDYGHTYKAALKIITIPQNQSEVMSVLADGMDERSVEAYFNGFVEELVEEFTLMSKFKGNSNVVSYEDHAVVKHTGSIGWDIIIRMELLTSRPHHTHGRAMAAYDVMRLGIDICRALELCQKYNVVHRGIKPEIIFVSELGDDRLGDFGIARTVEKTTSGLSKKGTFAHMAPEVYRGGSYSQSVDQYSLGIVLYRLLNENRTPFLPMPPALITHGDRETALAKRIAGMSLPAPKNADGRLAGIVLKACAFAPGDRYHSPTQMREELEELLFGRKEAPAAFVPGGGSQPKEARGLHANGRFAWEDTANLPGSYVSDLVPRLRTGERAKDETERIAENDATMLTLDGLQAPIASALPKRQWRLRLPLAASGLVILAAALAAWLMAKDAPPQDPPGGTQIVYVMASLPPAALIPSPTAASTPAPTATPIPAPTAKPTPMPSPTPTPAPTAAPMPMTTTTSASIPTIDYSVSLSYSTLDAPPTDDNVNIHAYTSHAAQRVDVRCESAGRVWGTWNMATNDSRNWSIDASIYKAVTYLLTVTAYFDGDVSATDSIYITYPF